MGRHSQTRPKILAVLSDCSGYGLNLVEDALQTKYLGVSALETSDPLKGPEASAAMSPTPFPEGDEMELSYDVLPLFLRQHSIFETSRSWTQ